KRDQRSFADAISLLDRALALHEESADFHQMGRTFISKARVLEDSGDLQGAIDLLPRALELVDPQREPRLVVYGRYNLIWCLTTAGRHEEAARLLPEIRELFTRIARPLDLVRLRWAEGRIAAGLGDRDLAEAAFREVQHEFFERHMGY